MAGSSRHSRHAKLRLAPPARRKEGTPRATGPEAEAGSSRGAPLWLPTPALSLSLVAARARDKWGEQPGRHRQTGRQAAKDCTSIAHPSTSITTRSPYPSPYTITIIMFSRLGASAFKATMPKAVGIYSSS